MKKISCAVMGVGMVMTIVISNIFSVVNDGLALESLRNDVLRLHILANSDSSYDQQLKICVRDALLENKDEIFGDADCIEDAEEKARCNIKEIEETATEVLAQNGCMTTVTAEITNAYFESRTYGDITMPAGEYKTLRVKIGKAEGHNWWCVMYPPLCIPAACDETITDDKSAEEKYFNDEQKDILCNPDKYEVKFALWEKFKSITNIKL